MLDKGTFTCFTSLQIVSARIAALSCYAVFVPECSGYFIEQRFNIHQSDNSGKGPDYGGVGQVLTKQFLGNSRSINSGHAPGAGRHTEFSKWLCAVYQDSTALLEPRKGLRQGTKCVVHDYDNIRLIYLSFPSNLIVVDTQKTINRRALALHTKKRYELRAKLALHGGFNDYLRGLDNALTTSAV